MPFRIRLKLSLANKCRLGFALAVLLIIGSALFVPYRWMDKLVEQGKLELAQSQVQHVLDRHFQSAGNRQTLSEKMPSLMALSDNEGPIIPVQWSSLEDQSKPISPSASLPSGLTPQTSESSPKSDKDAIQTRWIPLPPELAESHTVAEPEKSNLPLESNPSATAEAEVSSPASKKSELPGNPFERGGFQKFLQHRNRWEIFQMQDETARYLRAVRADRSCLSEGCHGRPAPSQTNEPQPQDLIPKFSEGQLIGEISITLPSGQTGTTLLFNRIFIVVAGVLAGICAIVTFYLITQRFILHPVRKLRRAADHFSAPDPQNSAPPEEAKPSLQEVMDTMDSVKTGDEFERLAQAFLHMLEKLKISQDRLQESNRALDLQLGELEAKNIALYESNKLKSEFLANVSHELRTPLNAIIGFAEILHDQPALREDEKSQRYAKNVLESGKLLLGIINDLLDLAKMEAGKAQIHWEKCSLQDIAEALVNFTRPLIEQKSLDVQIQIDPSLGLVESDPGKVQQIMFNLLSNAIKFTPEKGRILIQARSAESDHFEILVEDNGPGIPEEDREKIFEKFRQLDGSITRQHPGTGLGLAIVKELVQILNGSITVGGKPGEGAVFMIRLPIHKMQPVS